MWIYDYDDDLNWSPSYINSNDGDNDGDNDHDQDDDNDCHDEEDKDDDDNDDDDINLSPFLSSLPPVYWVTRHVSETTQAEKDPQSNAWECLPQDDNDVKTVLLPGCSLQTRASTWAWLTVSPEEKWWPKTTWKANHEDVG